MRNIFIVVFVLVSFNSFGQHRIFVAIQEDGIRQQVSESLMNTKNMKVVYKREDSQYIIRVVTKAFPSGIAASIVITWPFNNINDFGEGRLLYPRDQLLDKIYYQACITAPNKDAMAKIIYDVTVNLIDERLKGFQERFFDQ